MRLFFWTVIRLQLYHGARFMPYVIRDASGKMVRVFDKPVTGATEQRHAVNSIIVGADAII